MDSVYGRQRHIYDLTRKYYLFGRDRLIDELGLPAQGAGSSVLEIGCGTGRNLARVQHRYPQAALFGIDISSEMLKSAQVRLGSGAVLGAGDAAGFDAATLLGRTGFDRLILSYCLSMIPPWQEALQFACTLLAPGGSIHIVDFGDMAGLPAPVRSGLRTWLGWHHVTPRDNLADLLAELERSTGLRGETVLGPGHYYQLLRLRS